MRRGLLRILKEQLGLSLLHRPVEVLAVLLLHLLDGHIERLDQLRQVGLLLFTLLLLGRTHTDGHNTTDQSQQSIFPERRVETYCQWS